jgi:hypothetical protein
VYPWTFFQLLRDTPHFLLAAVLRDLYYKLFETCNLPGLYFKESVPTSQRTLLSPSSVDSSWNVMAHGDARVGGEWRGNWRKEWIASTLHTTSEHGVSSITTADAHTPAASSRLNWRPRRFKWAHPFCRKTKSGFCACAITFQLASTTSLVLDIEILTVVRIRNI